MGVAVSLPIVTAQAVVILGVSIIHAGSEAFVTFVVVKGVLPGEGAQQAEAVREALVDLDLERVVIGNSLRAGEEKSTEVGIGPVRLDVAVRRSGQRLVPRQVQVPEVV